MGLEKYLNKKVKVIISDEQLQEIISVIERPKFHKYFDAEDIKELLFLIRKVSETVIVGHTISDCRDKKDNFILETALKGKAGIIVTGDEDLLVLNPYKGISIVTYQEFERIVKNVL